MTSADASATPGGLDAAMGAVGDRWSLLVVDALMGGPRRFAELEGSVAGIATNVLTSRLRQLEAAGVVLARPYQRRPLRSTYELTATGRELASAITLLAQWGATLDGGGTALAHRMCGTALEARWWCPTCDRVVDDPGEEPVTFA